MASPRPRRSGPDRTSAVPPDGCVRGTQVEPVEDPVPALVAHRDKIRVAAADLEADHLVQPHRGMVVAADVQRQGLHAVGPRVVDERRDQPAGEAYQVHRPRPSTCPPPETTATRDRPEATSAASSPSHASVSVRVGTETQPTAPPSRITASTTRCMVSTIPRSYSDRECQR